LPINKEGQFRRYEAAQTAAREILDREAAKESASKRAVSETLNTISRPHPNELRLGGKRRTLRTNRKNKRTLKSHRKNSRSSK
jgi:hypothetical protein